jgi:hypothetical protein
MARTSGCPSDPADDECALVEPLLPPAGSGSRPQKTGGGTRRLRGSGPGGETGALAGMAGRVDRRVRCGTRRWPGRTSVKAGGAAAGAIVACGADRRRTGAGCRYGRVVWAARVTQLGAGLRGAGDGGLDALALVDLRHGGVVVRHMTLGRRRSTEQARMVRARGLGLRRHRGWPCSSRTALGSARRGWDASGQGWVRAG